MFKDLVYSLKLGLEFFFIVLEVFYFFFMVTESAPGTMMTTFAVMA